MTAVATPFLHAERRAHAQPTVRRCGGPPDTIRGAVEAEATLAGVAAAGGLDVVRDASFSDLALVGHAAGRSLVYAAQERSARDAGGPGVAAVITLPELAPAVP